MDVQVAALCDSAADYNGKLCLLGTFDTITARALPVVHPYCSIAIRIKFSKVEEGNHKLKIGIIDDDGKLVMPGIEASMELTIPEGLFFVSRNMVLNIQQLKFEREGQYSIEIAIDGRLEASIPLQVKINRSEVSRPDEQERNV